MSAILGGKPITMTMKTQAAQNRAGYNLPFIGMAVGVDNHTNQWLYLVEADAFIPPFYTDRIIPTSWGINSLSIVTTAPPGYTQVAPVLGQQARITPYSERMPASPGVYQPPQAGLTGNPQIIRVGTPIPQAFANGSGKVPVQVGALNGVAVYAATGVGGSVTLTSMPSGIQLVSIGSASSQLGPIGAWELPISDNEFDYTVTNGVLVVWTIPEATIVYPNGLGNVHFNQPVDIEQFGGTQVAIGQQAMVASMPVTLASDQAYPGQRVMANSDPVVVASDQQLASGSYVSSSRGLIRGPTKSANTNQATANANTDLSLFSLGVNPIIFAIRLRGINTGTTSGAWATVRLHGATTATDIWIDVLFCDKAGSTTNQKYWDELTANLPLPIEPALFSGNTAESWSLIVNASQTGVFWGGAIRYA